MDQARRELEFVGELGRGGFGAVYLANLHGGERFVRRVAVKVLKPGLLVDPQVLARQRDEARLLGLLSHHAVVQVIDLTTVQGQPAVIMEYVEGLDASGLAAQLRQDGQGFPERAALEIVRATASALHAVYSSPSADGGAPLRVIHRDIKPANLLVTTHGGVKVLDFGVARADFNREGVTGSTFFGTAAYMAPEFWLGDAIGPAYDVFALGVTLLELLSGRAPERAVLERGRYQGWLAARLAELPLLQAETIELIARMLAFSASERPVAREVEELAESAAGRSPTEGLPRLARRVLPPLLEARLAAMSSVGLPSRSELLPGFGPAEAVASPTMRATTGPAGGSETLALPTRGGNRWLVGLLGGASVVATIGAFGLWRLLAGPGAEATKPEASPAPAEELRPEVGEPGDPGAALPRTTGLGTTDVGTTGLVAVTPSEGSEPATSRSGRPGGSTKTTSRSSTAGGVTLGVAPPVVTTTALDSPGSASTSAADVPVPESPAAELPRPASATAAPTSPAPEAAAATTSHLSEPVAESPAASSVAPPTSRRITFASAPIGGEVFVNATRRCSTPCSVPLPDGSYKLQIRVSGTTVERAFTVGAGQPNFLRYDAETAKWSSQTRGE